MTRGQGDWLGLTLYDFFIRYLPPAFADASLITLAARSNTLGIVSPICLAAFRLMMNSNFFGWSTGRSAGLAPFRICRHTWQRAGNCLQRSTHRYKTPSFYKRVIGINHWQPTSFSAFHEFFSV